MIARLIVPRDLDQNPKAAAETVAEELRGQYPWIHSIRVGEMTGHVTVQFDGSSPLDLKEIVEDCLGWMLVEETLITHPAPPKNV